MRDGAPSTKFVWPPVPDAPTDAPVRVAALPADRTGAPAGGASGIRGFLREAESFWLAPVALPLVRRAAASGWAPDALSAYCNRCGQTVGAGEDDEFGCARCRGKRLAWSRATRLGDYAEDLASWVREVKFARNASLGVDLGRLLATRLREAGLATGGRVCVVPIPMSRGARLWRGIDHAACIGEGVSKGLGAPLVGGLTRRRGPSQRSMGSVAARERNARAMFGPAWGVDLGGWTTVLVDDVMTTGATMRAAAKALRRVEAWRRPASVWAAVVGVTPDRDRRGPGDGADRT